MSGKYVSLARTSILFFFWFFLLIPASSQAVPARLVIESLTQPDGTIIRVRQFGDERSNGLRTQDGYTILRDETTGFWVYAETTLNGSIQKSPFIVGHQQPLGIPKYLSMPASLNGIGQRTMPLGQVLQSVEPAPNLGSQPVLVIFVDFSPSVRVGSTASTLNAKFFGVGSSVKDYYEAVSYGNFSISPAPETDTLLGGDVNDGVVSVVLNYAHPNTGGTIDVRNQNITRDALIAADSFVNFAQFDTNGDGTISPTELHTVFIVGGYERSFASSPCGASVWGHRWGLSSRPILDGKTVGTSYTQFGEWHCSASAPPGHAATIGIMVHELGHDLELPDLYDTDGSSQGVGTWSVMSYGSWNGVSLPGDSPAHFDPWSKYFEGWISPILVTTTLTNEPIAQAATTPDVYQFLSGTPTTGEYFLVENRQKIGYDAGLVGSGLLIWHIDASKAGNSDECYPEGPSCAVSHYKIAVSQADNLYGLEKGGNSWGDAGDPWPGSTGNRNFTSVSSPNSNLYNGTLSNVNISNISNSGPTMTATLSTNAAVPALSITDVTINEGNSGTTPFNFTVTMIPTSSQIVTVNFATADGTASAASGDYVATFGSLTFSPGETSKPVSVLVNGDTQNESNETFFVSLSNSSNATISKSQGLGTLTNDDLLDTILDPGPAADGGATNSTTVVFNFTSTAPTATFACSLDAAVFTVCTSPKTYTGLKVGSHNFKVQATADGVTDPTPATFDWTIDKKAPNTTITVFPTLLTKNPIATFEFISTEVGGGFQCSLDGVAFAACTSPFMSGVLIDGKHSFQVKAVDAAGNPDKSAAKAKAWTVDTTLPVTTITGKPTNPTTITSATFRFRSEIKSTFMCKLDGGAFEACKSAKKYSGLLPGAHTFQVQATDAATNVESIPVSYNWTQN